MAKREVDIIIKAEDKASKKFDKIRMKTQAFAYDLGRSNAAAIRAERVMIGMSAAATGVAVAFSALGASVNEAARFEQLSVAFETLVGNMDEAQLLMRDLIQFSVRTPFEPDQVLRTAKTLVAFGIETQKVNGLIEDLGELSAGSGASLDRLGDIVGKVFTKGRAQAEELNRFAEAGIPIVQELARQYGKTEQEILKMASAGEITFTEIEKALDGMTSEGGKFFGLMEKQSKTAIGLWSTLKGQISETGKGIGSFLLPAIKGLTEGTSFWVEELNKTIDGLKIMLFLADQVPGGDPIERQQRERQPLFPPETVKSAEEITKELQLWALETQKVETLSKRLGIDLAEAQALIAMSANDQKITIAQLEKEKTLRDQIANAERRRIENAKAASEAATRNAAQSAKNLQEQIEIQKLLNSGKERQAAIQQAVNRTAGKGFTLEEVAKIAKLRGELFDLQKKTQQPAGAVGADQPGAVSATVARFLSFRGGGQQDRTAQENKNVNEKTADNTAETNTLIQDLIDVAKQKTGIMVQAAGFGG